MSIQFKVTFSKEELLSKDDFNSVVYSAFPLKKAAIVSKSLQNHMFIKNNTLYILQKNFIYSAVNDKSNIDSYVWQNVSTLLSDSYEAFDKKTLNEIQERLADTNRKLSGIFAKSGILGYIDPIKTDLIKEVELDSYIGQLHYRNGFIDIKTQKFRKRDNTHYITKYIDRDYVRSSEKQRQKLLTKYLKPIYPKAEDLDCIMGIFGSALTGKSTKEQDMCFLLGEGSSGKSTILLIVKEAITIYFQELKADTFSTSNSEQNKLANTYLENRQILITWINEMTSERINASFFKSFVEGNCTTTKLYTEGSFQFTHKSKPFATSNEFPNIQIDSGSTRRVRAYTHQSEFVDDPTKVNEKKNIYLKNKNLLTELAVEGLLDALIDILVEKASGYMKGDVLVYTENFADTKDIVVSSNDYVQDFIDAQLIITTSASDRIGKRAMHTKFHEMYPNKHLKELDIISSLKSRKIVYDKGVRDDESVRGCFICVKFKDSDLHKATEYEIEPIKEEQHKSVTELEEEITRLKKLVRQLKEKPLSDAERYNNIVEKHNKTKTIAGKTEKVIVVKPKKVVTKVVDEELTQDEADQIYLLF